MIGISITYDPTDTGDVFTARTASINDLGAIAARSLQEHTADNLHDVIGAALDGVSGYQGTCAVGLPHSLMRLDERPIPGRLPAIEQKRAAITFANSYFPNDGVTQVRTIQRTIADSTTHSLFLAAISQSTVTTIRKAMKRSRRFVTDITPNAFGLAKATGLRERTIIDLTDIADKRHVSLYLTAPPAASQHSWAFTASRIGKDELDTIETVINDAVQKRVIAPPTSIGLIDPHGIFPEEQRLAGALCQPLNTRLDERTIPYIIAIGVANGEVTVA